MTAVVDISCPGCGAVDEVSKRAIDRYRCAACGREFSQADVVPDG